ncbi:hypothetical protein F5B19DRAFT_498251 [Rostrohypoxylon terebratum]|nr:hypothetical protein F5B19DRAFT_498251 [Rostrohypoxylon terebratum]
MSVKNYYADGGEQVVTDRLRTYFDRAPLFKWGGKLGAGANGIVYKVFQQVEGKVRTLAVKIVPIDVDLGGNKSWDEEWGQEHDYLPPEVESLEGEKLWLRVHLLNDPLSQKFEDIIHHRMRTWLFMEYAENGGLERFVERHAEHYAGEPMPNRLLWRLFMCLIRGCIDMGYYNKNIDLKTTNFDALKSIEPGPLAHQDLGSHNVVLGDMSADNTPEHNVTPMLKIIDFGEADTIDSNEEPFNRNASQINVGEISRIMVYLILLDTKAFKRVTVTIGGVTFNTFASAIYKRHNELVNAGIDEDLLYLVYRGTSLENNVRPGLAELAEVVHDRVTNRGDRGVERETDQAIKTRVFSLLYDADTQPQKRDRDADDRTDVVEEDESERRRLDETG